MSWLDIDSGSLQVLVDDRPQHRSRVRNNHEFLSHQVLRTDGFQRGETVITRQDHYQRLLDENTVRQLWHAFFPSEEGHIDFSFRQAVRKQRGVLTRYHHVDIWQLVPQNPQGFGHPP